MKVRRMIEELQKYNPEAEVKLHYFMGHNALFVLQVAGKEDVVFIEDKSDNDLAAELSARFEAAAEAQVDELDFYMDLLEIGYTLDDIRENLGAEEADHMETFCREHGLI